jgi:AcrR family transcriptional regulator
MSYLKREARRETILTAAMNLALVEGFGAMTVRRIAGEAGIAAGQVHHHFSSSSALKAEAFLTLVRNSLNDATTDGTWRDRLWSMLGADTALNDPYLRLWREAQVLAEQDPILRQALATATTLWHEETAQILRHGAEQNAFQLKDHPEAIAWRLIALLCGMDGLIALELPEMTARIMVEHMRRVIDSETGV